MCDLSEKENIVLDNKFAKNLIRFVLLEYMVGLHWTPTGVFAEELPDSPFTTKFRKAIVSLLETEGHVYHRIYDSLFEDKTLVEETHFTVTKKNKDSFVENEFAKDLFLSFCAILAQAAGLSYLYGATSAPYDTYMVLVTALRELRRRGKIGNQFWKEMQDWLENQH